MEHQASIEQIETFESVSRLFGHHGKGFNKSIDMITSAVNKRVWYVVNDHRIAIYSGPDLDEAVKIYNFI